MNMNHGDLEKILYSIFSTDNITKSLSTIHEGYEFVNLNQSFMRLVLTIS